MLPPNSIEENRKASGKGFGTHLTQAGLYGCPADNLFMSKGNVLDKVLAVVPPQAKRGSARAVSVARKPPGQQSRFDSPSHRSFKEASVVAFMELDNIVRLC